MLHTAFILSDHDRNRLADINHVALEKHLSDGAMVRRLVYHLDTFQDEILPKLAIPPVEGNRSKFWINLHEGERTQMRCLAHLRHWSMTDLVRALLEYHWQLRQAYFVSQPELAHDELAFEPERVQPWYAYHRKAVDPVKAFDIEPKDYEWNESWKDPAQVRDEEQRAEQTERPLGWNTAYMDSGLDLNGISCFVLLVIGSFVTIGGIGWALWIYLPQFIQLMSR